MNVPAGEWLRKNLDVPVYFENNAKLSAFSEIWFGDNRDGSLQNFICVTSRDGIGTGIIINGEIYNGARDGAAEFGHVSLFPYGERCPYLQSNRGARSLKNSGEEITIQEIIRRALQGATT